MDDAGGRGVGLVVFDCDGVLVDSEPAATRVLGAALRAEGLSITDEAVHRAFLGLTFERTIEIAERELGRALSPGFAERVRTLTFEEFRKRLAPMPGIEEALDGLRVPYCVASSGEHEKMRLTLGLTGLLDRFRGRMFSAADVPRGKPAPDLFLHAAARMGVPPARTVVVEDSVHGVEAAVAAGMRVLGYAPRTDGAELRAAGAELLRDLGALPRRIEGGTG